MIKYIFLVGIILVTYSCKPSGEFFDSAICIANISTIDAKQGLQEGQTVIIQGNKIIKTGPTNSINLSPKNNIVDGTGKYLIPGLWDAHVHFAYLEDLAPSMFKLFLAYGITSIRDTGGKIDFVKKWKVEADANPTTSPRVKIAGPLLDGLPNVYDGSTPERPQLSVGMGSVQEATRMVDQMDAQGVDLFKAYEMLTPEQFVVITARAKEKGKKVTGHVPLSMDVITASDAGLNSMEHLRNLEMSCAKNWEELLQDRRNLLAAGKNGSGGALRSRIHASQRYAAVANQDPVQTQKVLATLAKNQTWQIPTLALISGAVRKHFATPEWMETFKLLPDHIEEDWNTYATSYGNIAPNDNTKNYTNWALDMVGKVHEAGIGIMAGTDCPIFFLTPGRSLHQELVMLAEAGLSPLEVLATATTKPAEYFNMQGELGLIQEGYFADLLILNNNPLVDIRNTMSIETVIRDGRVYDGAALGVMKESLVE